MTLKQQVEALNRQSAAVARIREEMLAELEAWDALDREEQLREMGLGLEVAG
jgi:hypothetical protein